MADDMDMSQNSAQQLELWTLLGQTRVVTDASDRLARPGKVSEPHATDPARFEAQMKDRGITALGKSPAGRMAGTETWAERGAAKGKQKLTIARARWGNRPVIARRD